MVDIDSGGRCASGLSRLTDVLDGRSGLAPMAPVRPGATEADRLRNSLPKAANHLDIEIVRRLATPLPPINARRSR